MTPTEFLATVAKNHRSEYAYFHSMNISEPLVHGAIGVSTEAGELLDVVKKAMIYGKEPDLVNIKEELGDTLWYIGLMCIDLGCTFEDLFDMNWEKLKLRYEQGKFSEDSALNRNLSAERVALESSNTAALDMVSPRVGGAITRAFIRLTEKPPIEDDKYLDPASRIQYSFKSGQWVKDKVDAG